MHYLAQNCCYDPRVAETLVAETLFERTKQFINLFLKYKDNLLRTRDKNGHTPHDIASNKTHFKQTEKFKNLFKCSK